MRSKRHTLWEKGKLEKVVNAANAESYAVVSKSNLLIMLQRVRHTVLVSSTVNVILHLNDPLFYGGGSIA